jgi:coenzyme F420-reducing hydrogenase beta subunit
MKKFSAWSNDEENLFNSSSGGIFLELAKKILSENGKVVGVIMDGIKAKYIISNDLEEIKKMRGSKYIPSNPSQIIKKIKGSTEKILFTGLPCHIEAVKSTCDTSNMILCDLVCHGLPKDGVFEKHIKKISKGRSIKSITFRDKSAGWWLSQSLKIVFSNGEVYDCFDEYYKSYVNNTILREYCKVCKRKRMGDITLGDFWRAPPSLKNDSGTSIVIINTKKGKEFFNSIDTITKNRYRFYHNLNMSVLKYIFIKSITKSGMLNIFKKSKQ